MILGYVIVEGLAALDKSASINFVRGSLCHIILIVKFDADIYRLIDGLLVCLRIDTNR